MRRILAVLACLASSDPAVAQAQDDVHFLPGDRVAVRDMRTVPSIDLAPGVRVRTVVGATGSFSLADSDSGSGSVLHHHTREQADVGIAGVFEMTLGNHVERLGPGAGVIVPPNVAHSLANKGTGVMTVIEFHTVRRPDLVPPRPALTFPVSPEAVALPDEQKLIAQLDEPGGGSSGTPRTIRGQTCDLAWRRLPAGAAATDIHAARTRVELFVYVVSGAVDLIVSGSTQRVAAGSVILIPGEQQHVRVQAASGTDAALVEFSPARR
jgi:quercetin dioxygenase-like cupin family protein